MTVLKTGSVGPEVRDLQGSLNQALPMEPALVIDGRFGPKTCARVITFQMSSGLVPDGVVGPMTRTALVEAALVSLGFRGAKYRKQAT
jgi:peptidoglycan hydrolase-like protein with peptidoglycan-binding domain